MSLDDKNDLYDPADVNAADVSVPARRRNSTIFALATGGVLVALALLAFLFYDDRSPGARDVESTASTRPAITQLPGLTGRPAGQPPVTTPSRPAPMPANP